MDLTPWLDLIAKNPALALAIGVCIVLLASWLAGREQAKARSRQFLAQLDDSTAAHADSARPASAGGFFATLRPAPEPFDHCTVIYRTRAEFNPLAWVLQLIAPASEHLLIRASLPSPPAAELVWNRGQIPATALGLLPGRDLWTRHRLDVVDVEYATRGAATNGVRHVFGELQNRFGPFLTCIVVEAAAEPHITVALNVARFDPAQMPVLMALVRSLGRAARID